MEFLRTFLQNLFCTCSWYEHQKQCKLWLVLFLFISIQIIYSFWREFNRLMTLEATSLYRSLGFWKQRYQNLSQALTTLFPPKIFSKYNAILLDRRCQWTAKSDFLSKCSSIKVLDPRSKPFLLISVKPVYLLKKFEMLPPFMDPNFPLELQ